MAERAPQPKRLWQWLIAYPTLLVTLGGGIGSTIPVLWDQYRAWRKGVESSRLQIVEEQQKLWERNIGCLGIKPVYLVTIGGGIEVGVVLCPSGDALLKYARSKKTVTFTWIPYPQDKNMVFPQVPTEGALLQPETRVVYGMTRCASLQGIIVFLVEHDDETGRGCHMDSITTTHGRLLKTQSVACEICDG